MSRWGFLLLVCVHIGLIGFLGYWYSPTQDETAHLPAGLAVLKFGRTDLYRVNPPLVRTIAALPVMLTAHKENWTHYVPDSTRRCEWDVGSDFVVANGRDSLWLFTIARWMCLPYSVIGLLVCRAWGRELSGEWGGWIAALLWAFSPNILGHGALLTNDIPATSLGLLAAWRFHRWMKTPIWKNAFFCGVCLGLALLSKTYWGMLLGIWPALGAIAWIRHLPRVASEPAKGCIIDPSSDVQHRLTTMNYAGQLTLTMLLGVYILNLGYGFHGSGTALREIPLYSESLSGKHRNPEFETAGDRFQDHWLGRIPVPLPIDYITGIDIQKHDFEQPRESYLLGEWRRPGWWYYYLIGLGVKVPLGTWCLVLLGTVTALTNPGWQKKLLETAPLWLPAILLFGVVSAETGMNRHVRYVFPILPVLYLLASQSSLLRWKWVPCVPLTGMILASLSTYPHNLSFFNRAAGGPLRGGEILIDSNLDWGQDLRHAGDWLDRHPECRPATLFSVAGFPHTALGIDIPMTPPGKPAPGWHLISVHLLNGGKNSYASFRNLEPVDRAGTTINIYHVKE